MDPYLPPSLPGEVDEWRGGGEEGGPRAHISISYPARSHMPIGHAHNHTPVARGAGAASALLQTTSGEERRIAQYNKG